MADEHYEVVVVGGSWAGLTAALQLGRARRRVLVVDAGRPRNRTSPAAHGVPGQDGRSTAEIQATLRAEVLAYPTVEHRLDEVVAGGDAGRGRFELDLATGVSLAARRLVIATGVVDEFPDLQGFAERWGRTVFLCPYCHGYEVAGSDLGVLASGEKAIEEAFLLLDWGRSVTLFTNGTFSPGADQRAQLAERGVAVESRPIEALEGDAPQLAGVRVAGGHFVSIDALFTSTRTRMASPLAQQLGCSFEEGAVGPVIQTGPEKQTTVAGVFAAGDAARARHSAVFAAADGATAAISAHRSLVLGCSQTRPPGDPRRA